MSKCMRRSQNVRQLDMGTLSVSSTQSKVRISLEWFHDRELLGTDLEPLVEMIDLHFDHLN